MRLDTIDPVLAALTYRDSSTDQSIRSLTDDQVIRAINKRLTPQGKAKHKPTLPYADPTGELAVGRASQKGKRRGR